LTFGRSVQSFLFFNPDRVRNLPVFPEFVRNWKVIVLVVRYIST